MCAILSINLKRQNPYAFLFLLCCTRSRGTASKSKHFPVPVRSHSVSSRFHCIYIFPYYLPVQLLFYISGLHKKYFSTRTTILLSLNRPVPNQPQMVSEVVLSVTSSWEVEEECCLPCHLHRLHYFPKGDHSKLQHFRKLVLSS